MLDALNHNGPAQLSRVSRSYCRMATMRGTTLAQATAILNAYTGTLVQDLGPDGPRAQAEPRSRATSRIPAPRTSASAPADRRHSGSGIASRSHTCSSVSRATDRVALGVPAEFGQ